jgi:AcrR family transcriptional regulator
MREIAEAADLSAANLYYYFASKQELLFFCQDHSLDRMLLALRKAVAEYGWPDQKVARVIEAQLVLMLDELDGAAAHLEIDALPPRLRAPLVRKRDRYERALRELIAEGMDLGAFAKRDAALVTRAILGAINWTARWYRPDGDKSPAELAQAFSGYLVYGLEPKRQIRREALR